MCPPSVDCHRGACAPQLPEKAVTTISSGFAGFTVIEFSPSLDESAFVRLGIGVVHDSVHNKNAGNERNRSYTLWSVIPRKQPVARGAGIRAARLGLTAGPWPALRRFLSFGRSCRD